MYTTGPSGISTLPHISATQSNPLQSFLPELHIRHIAGLDVSDIELQEAVKATAPPPPSTSPYLRSLRWEPLDVNIWKGRLEVFNEAFVDAECIVCMEVLVSFSQFSGSLAISNVFLMCS